MKTLLPLLFLAALTVSGFGQSTQKIQQALDTIYPRAQVPMEPVAGVTFGIIDSNGNVLASSLNGVLALNGNTTIGGTSTVALGTITSTSATAFAVGRNGATNPAFVVDASTSSSTTGFKIKSAAGTAGLALSVVSNQTNENGTFDAKGSGTLTLNGTATGATVIPKARVRPETTVYTSDGAITLTSGVHFVEKTTTAAMTVAAPSSQDGERLTIISNTDHAHVITFTGTTLLDGTTGANSTATFTAFKGASITVVARGAFWLVESLNQCTCAP